MDLDVNISLGPQFNPSDYVLAQIHTIFIIGEICLYRGVEESYETRVKTLDEWSEITQELVNLSQRMKAVEANVKEAQVF